MRTAMDEVPRLPVGAAALGSPHSAQRCHPEKAKPTKDLAPARRGCTFLLLVQKKGTKENDTREGKISISPPPWTIPHSNDQTGLASPFWNSPGMPFPSLGVRHNEINCARSDGAGDHPHVPSQDQDVRQECLP